MLNTLIRNYNIALTVKINRYQFKTMQHNKDISILVVEDLEPIRDLIRDILEEDGYHVEVAIDGKAGLELFRQKHFDIVFTDFKMPEMSGCDLAEKIKLINKNTPVVLVTAWTMDHTDADLRRRGIDFIVKKPFRDEDLQKIVRQEMVFKVKREALSLHA
jgi:CheY-like chemotaxis protein